MKKTYLLLLLGLLCTVAFAACAPRTMPQEQAPQTAPQQEEDAAEKEEPSAQNEQPKEPDMPENAPQEQEQQESQLQNPSDSQGDSEGSPQSGTFLLMDSGYEIQLPEPFQGIYNPADNGFYISVKDDDSFHGIVAYLTGDDLVAATEEDISHINEALANDPSVFNFQYDRQKQSNGMYYITFTYTNAKDKENSSGFSYVHYQKTPGGLLSIMINCPRNDYAGDINTMFQSVVPATKEAEQAPSW